MKTGLILMTALLPTKGHKYLIEYARNFLGRKDRLEVIISARSFEPISGEERARSFFRQFEDFRYNVNFHLHKDDDAPQNPPIGPQEEIDNFWNYWKNVIGNTNVDYVFASEPYGAKLAELLTAEFIPVDMNREIVPVKSTDVRKNILTYFNRIMFEMQPFFRKTITFFGAESTGKTTWTKWAAKEMNGYFVHEWARPYLETVGPALTRDKMATIVKGQYAAQKAAQSFRDKPFIFQDTDLLSTIGYYQLKGWKVSDELIGKFLDNKSDLYIVMDTDIGFEPDQLRYGGHKRESDTQFWIDLLEKYNCNYLVFQRSGVIQNDQTKMKIVITRFFTDGVEKIANFERE